LGQVSFYLISRSVEFFDRSAHPSGEFGQLLRPEQEQNDKQDYNHVRPHEVENTSDRRQHKKTSEMVVSEMKWIQSIHTGSADFYSTNCSFCLDIGKQNWLAAKFF